MQIRGRLPPMKKPLVALISVILIAGFLVTNISNYYISKQSLRQALINNELPLTSNNIYSEIQRDLLQPVFVASLMANDTLVKDWLLEGEQELDQITRYLDEIRNRYNVFTSFLVSDATRNYYHFSGLSQVISEQDPRDSWYFRVRAMSEASELNVDFNAEQNNALTIFINHRVLGYEGQFLAAVGVGLKIDAVANIISRYREKFGRNIYFIDAEGTILVRSEGANISEGTIQEAEGISLISQQILNSEQGFYEYEHLGERMLISSRNIPELGWRVVVEQQESEALSAIRHSLIMNTLIGLGVIAVTLVIVNLNVTRFQARLERMASTDKLTGAGNRAMFDIVISNALRRYQRDKQVFSVVMLDIDHFKRVNDTYGHLAGDKIIKAITRVIQSTMRESDTLCRWGGEELVILTHNCATGNAAQLAEKIRQTIAREEFQTLSGPLSLTISAGVAQVQNGDDADGIIRRADEALYRAKHQGRNCVRQA